MKFSRLLFVIIIIVLCLCARQKSVAEYANDPLLAWSPANDYIALATNTGLTLHTLNSTSFVLDSSVPTTAIAWSPNGQLLASADTSNTIHLWDIRNKREIGVLKGHFDKITALSWNVAGTELVSASYDKTARIWSLNPPSQRLLILHSFPLFSANWNPDHKTIVIAGGEADKTGFIEIHDTSDGHLIEEVGQGRTQSIVSDVKWNFDGTKLATASLEAQLWDGVTGKLLDTASFPLATITSLAWSPNTDCVAVADLSTLVAIWTPLDPKTKPLYLEGSFSQPNSFPVTSLSWSPDGKLIAGTGFNAVIRVWDTRTGKLVKEIPY